MNDITTVIVSQAYGDRLKRTLVRHHGPVIVVVNASLNDSAARLRKDFPEIDVVSLGQNRGLEAFNHGVKAAQTRYVALCDDSSWWDDRALAEAAHVLDNHPTIGLVAGVLRQTTHLSSDPLMTAFETAPKSAQDDLPGVSTLGFVDCFCITRRQPFLDQGGFDSLSGFGGLEQRLALDMADAGWAIRFMRDVIVWGVKPAAAKSRRIRDDVVTGLMRRPIGIVLARALRHFFRSPAGFVGVVKALARAPRALRYRSRVSDKIELRARAIEVPSVRTMVYAR